MTVGLPAVRHEDVVTELKALRERGLEDVRELGLSTKYEATNRSGPPHPADRSPATIEDLLRKAAKYVDGGGYEAAASFQFGITGRPKLAFSLNRAGMAAEVIGVPSETYYRIWTPVYSQRAATLLTKITPDQ